MWSRGDEGGSRSEILFCCRNRLRRNHNGASKAGQLGCESVHNIQPSVRGTEADLRTVTCPADCLGLNDVIQQVSERTMLETEEAVHVSRALIEAV